MREHYAGALAAYRKQDWDAAEHAFFTLHQAHPERLLFQIYLDRIAAFRNAPPADAWDGAFSYAVK